MNPLMGAAVLLLEDEFMIALDAQEMLSEMGVRDVHLASSLEQAQELARTHRFDAAILDVNINGRMSFELAEELQRAGVPVVFATGYELRERAAQGPADGPLRIAKPYTSEVLRAALSDALARAPAAAAG